MCGINLWPSGRVSGSVYCVCRFDLQWRRLRCALLMRLNRVETVIPYVGRSCFPDFLVMIILIYNIHIFNVVVCTRYFLSYTLIKINVLAFPVIPISFTFENLCWKGNCCNGQQKKKTLIIIIIIIFILCKFFQPILIGCLSLSASKSPNVLMNFHSILDDFNIVEVCTVSVSNFFFFFDFQFFYALYRPLVNQSNRPNDDWYYRHTCSTTFPLMQDPIIYNFFF